MEPDALFRRYQELQGYVGWTEEDGQRIHAVAALLDPHLPALVDDFYAEIDRHPDARKVITGGPEQVARLRGTLLRWLRELLSGPYDQDYVVRRWRVGWRHVDIGLDQVFTNAALSRLRRGLLRLLDELVADDLPGLLRIRQSLVTLLDLDLAIIEDAYQSEYAQRQQRVERLAAIGQVAGGVAHELRNPLNVVKTSVYYLLNARTLTPEKRTEHLKRIERQVGLADNVITALSSFARQPLPNMSPFAVSACVQEALEVTPMPPEIEVRLDLAPGLPQALGDPAQVRIVLDNLLRNAREAMARGGTLTISGRLEGNVVAVDVTDTGVGIAPEHLGQVLEPLYSTKARGLGLGLAIARSLAEKNSGSLHVVSQAGRGSTFTLRLPAVPNAEQGPS